MSLEGPQPRDQAELAARLIDAINAGDRADIGLFLDDASELVTGRGAHLGAEAIVTWATKEFDHLVRRYRVDELRDGAGSVLAVGTVEYLWRDGLALADSSPVALELDFADGRLLRMRVHDEAAELAALGHPAAR